MRHRLGVLAGAFNPVTLAHLALLNAARGFTDELVCVVPRVYPHKTFEGAPFEDRVAMLQELGLRVESTSGGLFIEIARELRKLGREILFICGADAAARIVNWDYGEPGAIEKQLEEYGLLVAARQGIYTPPEHLSHRIRAIPLDESMQEISSTEIRRRIAAREPWEHLVPEAVVPLIRRIYA